MATFKVGDRVRIINAPFMPEVLGRETTILAGPGSSFMYPDDYQIDITPPSGFGGTWAAASDLSPLTDPKADAFIESIKRLKPYEEPVIERVKV